MITRENYSIEHIRNLHESSKRDPNLIERVLFAFGFSEGGEMIWEEEERLQQEMQSHTPTRSIRVFQQMESFMASRF